MGAWLYKYNIFYKGSVAVDIITLLIILLLAHFSYQCYCLAKKEKTKMLSQAFVFLAVAYILKMLTHCGIHFQLFNTETTGILNVTFFGLSNSSMWFVVGTLGYRFLFLFGLYYMYQLYKDHDVQDRLLAAVLILLITVNSSASYLTFKLAAFILAILVAVRFLMQYQEKHARTTFFLFLGFFIIAISQLMLIVFKPTSLVYGLGEIVRIFGFLCLLLAFILVRRHGKKK